MTMKTLDEVIDDFEKACDLERRCENCSGCLGQENGCPYDGAESVPDALYYLKEYRDLKNTMDWHEEMEEIRRNLTNTPLTWDELKQMEGKPVWVVVDGKERWRIIKEVTNEYLILESWLPIHKCWMNHPNGWQAYRKERE